MSKESLTEKFASESSIHGIQFIFSQDRRKPTKIFWVLSLTLSLTFFGYYCRINYGKWLINPDISTNAERKIAKVIPFPAVTICSPLIAKSEILPLGAKLQYTVFEEKLKAWSPKQQSYSAAVLETCSASGYATWIETIPNRSNGSLAELLKETAPSIEETFSMCSKTPINFICSKLFAFVLTHRGLCYTYNMQGYTIFSDEEINEDFDSYKDSRKSLDMNSALSNEFFNKKSEVLSWTLDKGFSSDHKEHSVPTIAKKNDGILVEGNIFEPDMDNICENFGKMFTYYIHMPNEMITPFHEQYDIALGVLRTAKISAKLYRANDELRIIEPVIRGCYFGDERKLMLFKTYTKMLCDYECMINYTLNKCGCAAFTMPRNKTTRTCFSKHDLLCYSGVTKSWPIFDENDTNVDEPCGCLKNCNDVSYFVKKTEDKATHDFGMQVMVLFGDRTVETFESFLTYKLENFVADTGGLLGLFLGGSILSIIEVFYFIAITVFNKVKRNSLTDKEEKIQQGYQKQIDEIWKFLKESNGSSNGLQHHDEKDQPVGYEVRTIYL